MTMTWLEKVGLIALIISAIVLFSGRELPSLYAAIASTILSLGIFSFLMGGKNNGGDI